MFINHPNGTFELGKIVYVGVATNSSAAVQEGLITWAKQLDASPEEIVYLVEENSLGKAMLDTFPKRPQSIMVRMAPHDIVTSVTTTPLPTDTKVLVVAHLHGAFTTDDDLKALRLFAQKSGILLVVPAMLREDIDLSKVDVDSLGYYIKTNIPYKYWRDVLQVDVGIVTVNPNGTGWLGAVAKHRGKVIPESQRVVQLS